MKLARDIAEEVSKDINSRDELFAAIPSFANVCPDCGRPLQLKGTGCACDEIGENNNGD